MTVNWDAHIGYGVAVGIVGGLLLWKVLGFPCERAFALGISSCVIGSLGEIWERMS